MDEHKHSSSRQPETAQTAAEWLARMPFASVSDRLAFRRWLKDSPEHVEEILLASSTDVMLRAYLRVRPADAATSATSEAIEVDSPEIVALPEHRTLLPRNWVGVGLGIAATILLAVFIARPAFLESWLNTDVHATSIGEQRTVRLDDGSEIALGARSSVRVSLTRELREVYLSAGQALFSVAEDGKRPFRVHVDNSIVQAVGTRFDVQRRAQRFEVAVTEGVVQVGTAPSGSRAAPLANPTRVAAGQGVSVTATGAVSAPVPVDVNKVSEWQEGRLTFRNNTLAEIVEEFARYNRTPHLRVEGAELQARRFSATFNARNPEALLKLLEADGTIAIDRNGDNVVIRMRSGGADAAG